VIIYRESVRLEEILQSVGKSQLGILQNQMAGNEELKKTLTTPIGKLPQYQFLVDSPWEKSFSLFSAIKVISQDPTKESYFIKTSTGLYIGFITINIDQENGKPFVNGVKLFSFGISPKEDENMIRRDVPRLLDQCLKKFSKVKWDALKGNKANIAYDIYRKKRNGIRNDLGNSWEYICCDE
jgi:predicted transcriptional regulator YheO